MYKRQVQVTPQLIREGVVPELVQGLGLDLPYPLPRHAEQPAYLLQRPRAAVDEAVAELDDLALALAQRGQHRFQMLPQQQERGRLDRARRIPVLDQVAEGHVLLLADRGVQGDRFLGEAQYLGDPLGRQAEVGGDLFGCRLVAPLLEHAALHADDPVDQLDHVDRDAYGARLVGQGP